MNKKPFFYLRCPAAQTPEHAHKYDEFFYQYGSLADAQSNALRLCVLTHYTVTITKEIVVVEIPKVEPLVVQLEA